MSEAKKGDTVRVHYTGTLEDGHVFDSSEGRDPIEFTLGTGQVIDGFDSAVAGMQPGQTRRVTIPASDAYGERSDDRIVEVDRGQLPDGMDPSVGQQLQMSQGGRTFLVTVTDISDDTIVLDANHPLAGRALTFELKLVEIV